MKQLSPGYTSPNLRVFFACLLSFNIFITPIAAIAATIKQKPEVRSQKSEDKTGKAAVDDVFAKPLEGNSSSSLPAPRAEAAPAPPVVGAVTASMTAALVGTANNGDGKADPGDTINYTVTLNNTSGANATGLSFGGANIISPYAQLVTTPTSSIKSTPVAFDETPAAVNEDNALPITLHAQDPDGDTNLTFAIVTAPTAAMGTLGSIGSLTCDAAGLCSASVTYTPTANFNGAVSFTYKVTDSTGKDSNQVGNVSFTVNAVNDAPSFSGSGNPATVSEDAVAQTVTGFRTNVSAGPPDESGQTVTAPIDSNDHTFLFSSGPTLTVSGTNLNLTYTPKANANGTATIKFHLHDTGGTAFGGFDDSAQQTFVITVNAVNDAPVAQPKAFTVQANMKITGLTGLLTGVTDPDATNGAADPLSFDAQASYTTPSVTLTSVTLNTCTNGLVSNVQTNGTFDFDPPPGLSGGATCVLNYVVTDTKNPTPGVASAAQTITITAQGPAIWFVDPNRTNNGNGTLSNALDAAGNPGPFKSLSSANAKLATLATNQKVFIYTGTTASGVAEVLDLAANNDWLVGQGTVATSFDSFFGLTGGNAPPAGTITRPTLNSNTSNAFTARPTVSGTVTMRNNTQVTGVNIVTTGSNKGLASAGFTAGTSLIKDVSVTSATGNAVDLSGTQTVTYETSDGTNSPNVLIAVGGIALNVFSGVTIGANGFTFKSISANGGTNGIVLNTTGATAGLTVTGSGTTAGSGGTITNCSAKGADIRSATNISLSNMNFTNNATANLGASGTCGDALNGTNGPTTCNANISLSSVTTATLTKISATGSKQIGIDVKSGSNLTLTNMTVTGNGNETMEDGVQITDLTGTLTVAGGLFKDNAANQFEVQNGVAGPLSVIVGTSTFSNTAFPTGATTPANTTANSGLFLATHSSAVMNPTITNCIVDRIYAQGIRLDMAGSSSMTANIGPATGAGNGNTITNSNQAISLTGSNTGGFTYNIRNNTANIVPANVAGGATNQIGVARSTASGTWTGLIDNNFVGTAGTANSGCQVAGCDGIDVVNNSAGTHKLSIINNHIHDTEGSGMVIIAGGAPDNSTVSWTVQNNFIDNPDENAGQANPAILIQSGTSVGTDTSKTCLNISGNTISGTWSLGTGHLSSIRVRSLTTAAGSFAIVGFNPATEYPNDPTGVSGSTTGAVGNVGNVADYIRQQNPGVTNASPGQNAASATQGAAVFSNSGGCPLLLAEGGVMAALNSPSLISNVFFSSIDIAPAASPASSPITTANTISTSLTQPQLDMLVGAAILRWTVTGLSVEQIASLREIKFEVTDLTNAYLAESSGYRILVDRGAEGKGWFLDATPQDDSEFANALAATRRYTDPQSAPAGHIDLLTAIEHEMGHKLGLGDSYLEKDRDSLMYGYLTVGERRLPEKGQAAQSTAGGSATSHFLALEPSRLAIAFGEVLAGAVGAGNEVFDKAEAEIVGQRSEVSSLTGASSQRPEVRGQRSDVRLNHARSVKSEERNLTPQTTNPDTAAISSRGTRFGVPSYLAAVAPFFSGGVFPVNGTGPGFTLPNNKTITITFSVTVNNPPNFAGVPPATPQISSQGTLQGSPGTILTDNVEPPAGAADPTVLNADLFNTTSTITGASPSNSTNMGQSVTFTASIVENNTPDPAGGTLPAGTATFKDGASNISGCVNVTVTSGAAQCTTATLTAAGSPHTITVVYNGDGNFDPSTSANFTQTVTQNGTTTAVSSSQNPSVVTQNVTFTATVTSNGAVNPPTGTVQFHEGVTNYGTPVALTTGGSCPATKACASFSKSDLAFGPHTISGDYIPDPAFTASSGNVSQQVNKTNSSMTLGTSGTPTTPGTSVTFTAAISSTDVNVTANRTGTVTFYDGAAASGNEITACGVSGVVTVSSNQAQCSTSALSEATHTITAVYSGDGTYNGVTNTVQQVVAKNATTTVLVDSLPGGSSPGQDVTFTATVSSSAGTPTGTVQFFDGVNPLVCDSPANSSTQTLTAGVATCVTNDLTEAGSPHTIKAVYGPNATFGDSMATVSHSVTSCTATVVVTNTSDSGAGSLRNAISGVCDGGTITFSNSTVGGATNFYDGNVYTINLADTAANQLTIGKSLTITGPGASVLTVKRITPATNNFRIFEIQPGKTVSISGMTISNGNASGASPADHGGGIYNDHSTLTLSGVAVSGNTATLGGGVYNDGSTSGIASLTITNSTISANTAATGNGGGIYNDGVSASATLIVSNSTINGNSATGSSANGNGGGVYNIGTSGTASASLTNSTISGNTATESGGGLLNNNGTMTLLGCTVTGNAADNDNDTSGTGGGIRAATSTVTIKNTIVAGNFKGSGAGVQQVETLTVPNGATNTGDILVTVTAFHMSNSPKPVLVSVLGGDTAAQVATKIAAALTLDPDVGPFFNVSSNSADVVLQVKNADTDDPSMLMHLSGNATGISNTDSSTTVTGVAGSSGTKQVETLKLSGTVASCTGGAGTDSGTLQLTVAATGLTGSGTPVSVDITNGQDASTVADSIRTVLAGSDPQAQNISARYTINAVGSGPDITFTRKVAETDDTALQVTLSTDAPCAGIIADSPSEDTVHGVAPSAGTQQQETVTVSGGPVTHSGTIQVKVTAPGMNNSGKLVPVSVTLNETNDSVAMDIATALNNDGDVFGFFSAAPSGADVVLTANQPGADINRKILILGNSLINDANSVHTPPAGVAPATPNDINGNVDTTASASSFNLIGNAGSAGGLTNGIDNNIVGNSGSGTIAINTVLNTTLANNGGPTKTHALVTSPTNSPAIDNGNKYSMTLDQRGYPRPVNFDGNPPGAGDDSDIGAYEQQNKPAAPGPLTLNPASDTGAPDGHITSDFTPTIDIAGVTAGAFVELLRDTDPAGGSPVVVATGTASGTTISLTDNTGPGAGSYLYTARQTLSGAPTSDPSAPLSITLDNSTPPKPSAPVLDSGSDSGTAGDHITNDTTPTFNISNLVVGNTVELLRNGTPVASKTAAGTTDSLTDPGPLSNGVTYNYTARQTNGSGNSATSDPPATPLTIDTTVPAKPSAPVLDSGSDSGTAGDHITNDTTPTFNISNLVVGNTVELLRDGTPVASKTAASTTDSLTDLGPLSNGVTYNYTARQTTGAGNSATSDPPATPLTIDSAVTANTPDLQAGSDSGNPGPQQADDRTKTTPRVFDIAGTETGSTVELLRDDDGAIGPNPPVVIASGTGNGGTLSLSDTNGGLADGTYYYTSRQTDVAANVATSSELPVVLDTTVTANTPDLDAASDTGASSTDNRTDATTPHIFNVAISEANSKVELFRDSVLQVETATVVGTITTGGNAQVVVTAAGMGNSPKTVLVPVLSGDTASDVAGKMRAALAADLDVRTFFTVSGATDKIVLTTKKSAVNDATMNIATDNAGSAGLTASPTSADTTAGVVGTNVANTTGSGTVQLNDGDALADGTYQYSVRETDQAGNVSTSANLGVTIDTTAPTVVSITRAGTNPTNASSVNFTVTFSEPVQVSTVDSGDFFISKSGGITTESLGTITPLAPSGTPSVTNVFTVAVNTGSGDGTLRLDVVDNDTILDLMSLPLGGTNPGNGTFNSGEVYTIAKSNPFVQSITRVESNPTNLGSVNYTVTFNQPVTGVNIGANSDFTLTKTGGITTESITGLSGSGAIYTVTVNTGSGDGTLRLNVVDDDTIIDVATGTRPLGGVGLGNGDFNTAGEPNSVFTVDKTPPTVTVNQPIGQSDPVTGPSSTVVNFTALFSEAPVGFDNSDVTLTGSPAGSTATITQVDPITYNIGVSGMTASGTITVSIGANKFTDAAGNSNTSGSTSTDNQVTFNLDNFSTLEVNTTADTFDGSCDPLGMGSGNKDCTLREAITLANADTGAETITFAPALTSGGPAIIKLATALPNLSTDMTIQGPGANLLTVMRSDAAAIPRFRVFTITGGIVGISGLTITNGAPASGTNGVAGGAGTDGGGISNAGTLTLSAVTITGNSAGSGGNSSGTNPGGGGGFGGGIFNNGTLAINSSTINANNAGTGGDGVTGGTGGSGGGIYHTGAGTLTIINSTISGNQTGVGGSPAGTAGSGGGIGTAGTLTLTDSTVTANTATGSGGGLSRTAGVTTIQNSIIGGNTAASAPDISGTVQSDGFNLIQSTAGATINQNGGAGPNITGQDPLLNALMDNGGPTFTHSLQCTSPAIDKGNAFGQTTDQRGGVRALDLADSVYPNAAGGDGTDIGAYETQSGGGCVPTAVPPSPAPSTNEDTPVVITLKGTYSQNINLSFAITQNPTVGQLGAISAPNCVFNLSMTCTATVSYTPNSNANGADLFKFKVSAGGLDSDPADVDVTVNATNDPPTFLQQGNQTVLEDAGPQSVANFITTFSTGPPDESGQTVQFIVTNNTNAGLFSAVPAIDASGTLTYTPAANANGSATITIVAKDNGGGTDTSAPQSFTITVLSVNDAPTFTIGSDQTVLEDSGAHVVPSFATNISVGPAQESGQTAQFIITNNTNAGMFSQLPVISPTGQLTYTSAPDANGSATITVVLKDNGGTANGGSDTSAPQTFVINVTSVNDAPTLDLLGDRTINEDAPTQTVSLAGISAGGGETQVLAITATSSNPALIPNPTVSYTSPSTTGSISFTPLADQNGSAIITVTVNDGGGTANGGVQTVTRTFTVTVNAINDAPINNLPGPQTIAENSPLIFSTANANLISITDVDSGASPVRVTLTATNGVITLSTIAGLAFTVGDGTADPTMTFTGTLASINTALQGMTFTPTNGFSGAAALQIITNDQGNTGSGGPMSDTDTLSITVNDGGNLQFNAATYTVSENAGPAVITITRTGGSAGTATVQIATSNGTATAGSDYTAVNQTVTFNGGETSKTVNIPITDDLLNEPDETVNLTLSTVGGSGALGTPATAVLTIADDDPAGGYIKFSSPTYSVAEGGVATITVQRQGTLTQAVTVNFATSDDSDPASMVMCAPTPGNTLASSRCDFTSAFGRITFAAGDGADKTFKVLTTQDSYVEGPETFTVTLSSPTNSATLALPSTATVTITDDAIEPPTNPVDDSNAFVEQLYRDFLNRPSDPAGKAFWVNNIDHCNNPAQRPPGQTAAQCIQLSRIVTAAAFFLSIEFQATGGTAYLTNKVAFGSRPNFARFEQDAQQVGLNYVFGQPGAEALLEANKVAYYNDYVTRTDFVNTYGGVSDQTYVSTLIGNTGVAFTQAEHDAFVNGLANQSETRATVLRKISEKGTFRAAEFNSMFVLMEYYGFLRRNPDTAGFNFWLNKLNLFNGNYLDAEMVKAFIESAEYRQRFGP